MSRGYVYILTNECMPGIVKIGKTTRDVNARAAEISNGTGVPVPFKVSAAEWTPDCDEVERRVHDYLAKLRVNPGREFFEISPSDASQVVSDFHREIVEEFIEEFLPGETLIPSQLFVDPSSISIIGDMTGLRDFEVCGAIDEVRCRDESFDFEELTRRYKARIERTKKSETVTVATQVDGVTLQ